MVGTARQLGWPQLVLVIASVVACSSPSDEAAPTDVTALVESPYCSDLAELTTVLDEGGMLGRYHRLLQQIADESPPEHAETWSLMLTLSLEPFTYDNFNPALNSLDDITADLEQTCPRLGRFTVDRNGRIRGLLPVDYGSSVEVAPSVFSTQVGALEATGQRELLDVEPALAGLQRIETAFAGRDSTTALDTCPLATFDEIITSTPATRTDANSTAIEPLVADDLTANISPDRGTVVCLYRNAGFATVAEPIDTDDIRLALLNRFVGESSMVGEPLDLLGGTMQPFYDMAYSSDGPVSSWYVAWARDGILLLLVNRYDTRWAPDEAPDIAIEWLRALIPTMLENLATVDAEALVPA